MATFVNTSLVFIYNDVTYSLGSSETEAFSGTQVGLKHTVFSRTTEILLPFGFPGVGHPVKS